VAPKIFLVAGEASGDLHGSSLLGAIRELCPEASFLGAGGPLLREAGQKQLVDLTSCAVVGLWEVIRHYPLLRKIFYQLLEAACREKPDLIVLIDYPGFNLRYAQALRRLLPDANIAYYISPQLWAWRPGRARLMERVLDLLLVIFPFEEEWFRRRAPRLPVAWVGHPFVDRYRDFRRTESTEKDLPRLALLPGSRDQEIRRHLPLLLQAASCMAKEKDKLRFLWIAPDAARQQTGQRVIKKFGRLSFSLEKETGELKGWLAQCDLALVASGSASLECAFAGVPQLVFYQVHPLTYLAGKALVRVPYVSMVNLIAGRAVVPEFLQKEARPEILAAQALGLLEDQRRCEEMRRGMRRVVERLGPPGASRRAARWLLALLHHGRRFRLASGCSEGG
jgi:lipid-A-disaccharide synthase